jgi:hypothetical protein
VIRITSKSGFKLLSTQYYTFLLFASIDETVFKIFFLLVWDRTSRIKCKFDERSKKILKKRIILPKDDVYVRYKLYDSSRVIDLLSFIDIAAYDDPFFII